MRQPNDMLLAVLGVQLGYLSADDVLASARELAQPGETRSLSEFLVSRGVLDRARAQVLERLATRATTTAGGDAAQTLELLPSSVRQLAAQSRRSQKLAPPPTGVEGLVDEQPHRYFSAPRADAPPRELGRGSTGRVISMHDTVLGRDVAWKQPFRSTPADDEAIIAQARMIARLDHPAVVPVYELGRDSKGLVYATQRQVTGETLAQALTRASGLDERLALLPAVHTIARCVAKAHEAGVTHRRLACGSITLGRFGEVYLLGWSPPEEASALPESIAADLKALGSILHEVVTGLPAPVMGAVQARGVPDDLLGLCRNALGGSPSLPASSPPGALIATADQLAHELQAFIDGRRLGSFRYSSWQLLKRYVRQHTLFSLMAVTAVVLVTVVAATAAAAVREERDRARLFARRFLDDVALRLRPQPGVEPLLEQVTGAALKHYQRTTELSRAPREERLSVSRAMARLGVVSLSLSRLEEARASLDFADTLAQGLADASPGDSQARVVLAQTAAARAAMPGLETEQALEWAARARTLADEALASAPGSAPARLAAANARLQRALRVSDATSSQREFDDAVKLLEVPAKDPSEELARRQALGTALVERASRRAREGQPPGAQGVVERLAALRERAPDDVELQLSAARAELLLAQSLEETDAEGSRAHADSAAALAREVHGRRPDRAEAAALQVSALLLGGHAQEALAAARGLESRGVTGVSALISEAALLSGDFELAASVDADTSERAVLIRALASTWRGKPSDAVIQARALRGHLGEVGWPAGRLERALERLPRGSGEGEAAVRRFAARWREAGGEQALGELIAALEAQLR